MPSILLLLAIAGLFDYARTPTTTREGVRVRDINWTGVDRAQKAGYLVGGGKGSHPAILFVHWLEPRSADSNREQFMEEALQLAKSHGTVSLLVETMWSDPNWFNTRNRSQDYENTIAQLKELRRALDILEAQPGVDKSKIIYVGHDFGAMFGELLAGVDGRPRAYAFQAGTSTWSKWYLYGNKLDPQAKAAFIQQMAPLDPVKWIAKAMGKPVLFQFGKEDEFVTEPEASAQLEAAGKPKKLIWYSAGHGLNEKARKDRLEWIEEQLQFKSYGTVR